MAGNDKLTPAGPADVAEALAFALCLSGRRRAHCADDMMAGIAASRLVEHLALSGFVVMKQLPASAHSTSAPPIPSRG